jgi:kinesin family protein 2/24
LFCHRDFAFFSFSLLVLRVLLLVCSLSTAIQGFVADDLFALILKYEEEQGIALNVFVSYFEIYGGRCQDLLNSRQRLNVREDGTGEVVVSDLMDLQADSAESLHSIIETGNRNRTTHATESNDESSRSHAICQICIKTGRDNEQIIGRLSLIDLAGSERAADTKSHNRQRRMEGAEINKSLLALKECVRALDSNSSHVPYRASKLTLVLKDSFTNKKSRTVMIATVSPAASSADHTINTLRYADRIKERVVGGQAARNAAQGQQNLPDPAPVSGKESGSGREGRVQAPSPAPQLDAKPSRRSDPAPQEKGSGKEVGKGIGGLAIADQKPPLGKGNSNAALPGVKQVPSSDRDRKQVRAPSPQEKGTPYESENEDLLLDDGDDDAAVNAFHRTVQDLFEEEEDLLNSHMSVIQENAELLTEEGRLLQQIQGENNDIDAYAARLDQILKRKQELIAVLKEKLDHFRKSLQREEKESRRIATKGVPQY